jgi:acyl-CoA thioesterase
MRVRKSSSAASPARPAGGVLTAQVRRMEKELARRLNQSNVMRFLGFRLMVAEPGRVVLRFQVRLHHLQVHNVVHGGVIGTLADTAGGMATYLAVPAGTRVATVEMKINFLEPIERGTVTADARVIRCGRNFSVVECDVRDSVGRLAGKALMTFAHDAATNPRWRPGK